jgi:putative ABC transport system substrate-binding protein
MERRAFLAAIAGSVLAAPLGVGAQPAGKGPRIGILWAYSPSVVSLFAEAFRQGLRGLGYVEGQNIALEERWAEGRFDRLPSLAAELVRLNVDIIVTASTPAVQAASKQPGRSPSS